MLSRIQGSHYGIHLRSQWEIRCQVLLSADERLSHAKLSNGKLRMELTFCSCGFPSVMFPRMLCSEQAAGSSVKKGTFWKNSPFQWFPIC